MVAIRKPPRSRGGRSLVVITSVAAACMLLFVLVSDKSGTTSSKQDGSTSSKQACPVCKQQECPKVASERPASPSEILLPPINLLEMFGPVNALTSVSDIAYMAYRCIPPLKDSLEGRTDEILREQQAALQDKLVRLVAEVKGAPVDPDKTLLENLQLSGVNDPKFFAAREAIAEHIARYAMHTDGKAMCCEAKGTVVKPEQLGKLGGSSRCGVECIGYMSGAAMLQPISAIAKRVTYEGFCTDPPLYTEGYANEMVKRMRSRAYKDWFTGKTQADDSIIFAFQLLYEHHMVFLRQRWLGAVTMQNPFDAWAIQDIINEVKPDLIIEGGTANGGSALMWASILHLIGRGGRVITIDITDVKKTTFGANQENPWENPLWQKYVTFIHGSALDDVVYNQVKAAAANASRVLVLLDDNHQEHHVIQETEKYCPLATPGSYCITQDTKMGRFNWEGPMTGVETFLKNHPEFSSDRSRELLFTDHPRGYLRRADA